jgi:hypothetical protein
MQKLKKLVTLQKGEQAIVKIANWIFAIAVVLFLVLSIVL